jgi:hypothetical protein
MVLNHFSYNCIIHIKFKFSNYYVHNKGGLSPNFIFRLLQKVHNICVHRHTFAPAAKNYPMNFLFNFVK